MNQKFKAGSEVFSEDGQAAEYVARIPEGHIVRPMVEAYYGDEEYTHTGEPVTWRAVFKQPPVAKYSEELKTLHVEIAAARKALDESREVERTEARQRAAKFKKVGILKGIEDFIDGKITHYVESAYYGPPSIISIEDAKVNGNNYRSDLRLLTLGGCISNGEVTWTLNRYSDGSGTSNTVTPCTSFEQAEKIVKDAIQRYFSGDGEARTDWIEAAGTYGIQVPNAFRVKNAVTRITDLKRNIESNRRQADQYVAIVKTTEAEIAALEAFLGPVTPA